MSKKGYPLEKKAVVQIENEWIGKQVEPYGTVPPAWLALFSFHDGGDVPLGVDLGLDHIT